MKDSIRDKIYQALVKRYASESPKALKEVAYNMALAATTSEVAGSFEDSFWQKAERALERTKHSAQAPSSLSVEANKQAHKSLASCPICKTKMNLVKLLDDRKSYYCSDHKICQPLPVGE
jgi:hypothetical protein